MYCAEGIKCGWILDSISSLHFVSHDVSHHSIHINISNSTPNGILDSTHHIINVAFYDVLIRCNTFALSI